MAPAPGHAAPSTVVFESSIRKGPLGTQQARTLEFEENLNQTSKKQGTGRTVGCDVITQADPKDSADTSEKPGFSGGREV